MQHSNVCKKGVVFRAMILICMLILFHFGNKHCSAEEIRTQDRSSFEYIQNKLVDERASHEYWSNFHKGMHNIMSGISILGSISAALLTTGVFGENKTTKIITVMAAIAPAISTSANEQYDYSGKRLTNFLYVQEIDEVLLNMNKENYKDVYGKFIDFTNKHPIY